MEFHSWKGNLSHAVQPSQLTVEKCEAKTEEQT
jgi:hypothetical protein